jgi:hypothetical protein
MMCVCVGVFFFCERVYIVSVPKFRKLEVGGIGG